MAEPALDALDIGPAEAATLLAAPEAPRCTTLRLHDTLAGHSLLALLAAADRVLQAGALQALVVEDEFLLDPEPADAPDSPPVLDSLLTLAERMGWRLQQRTELQRDGRRSRQQLQFQREGTPEDRLHPVGAAEAEAMRALFASVFGHELPAAQWQWKYGDGRGMGVGLSRAGRLVAHYGGSSRAVLWRGRPARACQVCDVMVAPEANSALIRKGPMYQISATFLETELGWAHRHPLAFGFPSDRHHVLARRLKLYDGVDSVVCARWPATAPAQAPRLKAVPLQAGDLAPGGRHAATLQALWQRMAASFGDQVIGVRDAAWLRHRYLQHPTVAYTVTLLRRPWTRRAVGVLVTRAREQHLEVMDLLAPPAAFGELIAFARAQAAQAGLAELHCWITQSQLHRLAGPDGAAPPVQPLGITVPANIHTPGPVQEVKDRWFLLAGDADFT